MTEYEPIDDVWKSVEVAYEAIRERMKNGGPGWTPKTTSSHAEATREQMVQGLRRPG